LETTMPARLNDHDIVPFETVPGVAYEKRPARRPDGSIAEGLFNAWIWLDIRGSIIPTPPIW